MQAMVEELFSLKAWIIWSSMVNSIGNFAEYGGAICFGDMGKVANCNFTNNTASFGGAIFFIKNGTVDNASFKGNKASDGGAILICGDLTVSNSTFEDNAATSGPNQISLKENAKLTLNNVYPENLGPFYTSDITVIDVKDIAYGNVMKITVNISYNGIAIDKGIVTAVINNKTYNATIVNGTATIEIPNLDVGAYNCDIMFDGNENCTHSTKNVSFKVEKQNVVVTASDKAYVINYGGKYSVVVKDINNKLLSGISVTFVLEGKTLGTVNTDSNGVAAIALTSNVLKAVKAGNKKLVIKINDSKYTAEKTVKITVNKEKTKIVAKKKTFKKAKKVKKYSITLKNSKGKAIKKVQVTLKVKGKTYKAKTNSKGKATFKIKKLTKKGKFKATIKFKGNSVFKGASKKVTIAVK